MIDANRGVNLVGGWDKATSDRWNEYLMKRGFQVKQFHYVGFYRKGNGASFEAVVILPVFIQQENVRRMIKAGIDIMFIRKIRAVVSKDALVQRRFLAEFRRGIEGFPRIYVDRDRNAQYFNPESIVITAKHGTDAARDCDDYTLQQLREYVRARVVHFSERYYADLKKVYDKLITDESVAKTLNALKFRLYDAEGNSIYARDTGFKEPGERG